MTHCDDCGTRLNGGTCPNCDEELYILETQGMDMDYPLSDEFMEKVSQQELRSRKRMAGPGEGKDNG